MADYKAFDLNTLPKRRTSRTDMNAARDLLAVVQANGAASDMASYETAGKARNAGLRAARLLEHVAPDGQAASIRTFGVDAKGKPTADESPAGFAFSVTLKSEAEAAADETADETPAAK